MTDPVSDPHASSSGTSGPVWLRPWFQWVLGAVVVFLFLGFVLPPAFKLVYAVRSVLNPVVVALVLAYIFNPLVTWLHARFRVPRWAGTSAIMAVVAAALLVALVTAVPLMVNQGSALILKLKDVYPQVVHRVQERAAAGNQAAPVSVQTVGGEGGASVPVPSGSRTTGGEATHASPVQENVPEGAPVAKGETSGGAGEAAGGAEETSRGAGEAAGGAEETSGGAGEAAGGAEETSGGGGAFERLMDSEQVRHLLHEAMAYFAGMDWQTIATSAIKTLDIGTGVLGSAVSFTTYLLVFGMIMAFSFFFLSWKLGDFKAWFIPFIPVDKRDRTLEVLSKMDGTVSAWLRGRLIQALLLSLVLTVGWWIAGVPYWFLLGSLCGLLGLVPYLVVVGWVLALLLASLDAVSAGQFTIWVLVWPTVVYAIAQVIDGWVVEPLLQGKATEMGVLTVLLVVMIGGSLAGLIGLLLAIPVAACVKILMMELVLPRLRALAARPAAENG